MAVDADDEIRIDDTARVVAGVSLANRARVGGTSVAVGPVSLCEDARLLDQATLAGSATMRGRATLSGHASVIEQAVLDGDAWVFGRAVVQGHASINGHAQVFDGAIVGEGAVISGNAWVYGDARVAGEAWVHGRSRIGGQALICGTAVVAAPMRIGGKVVIGDGGDVAAADHFETHQLSWGETVTLYRCEDGTVGIGRNASIHGPIPTIRRNLLEPALERRIEELTDQYSCADVASCRSAEHP